MKQCEEHFLAAIKLKLQTRQLQIKLKQPTCKNTTSKYWSVIERLKFEGDKTWTRRVKLISQETSQERMALALVSVLKASLKLKVKLAGSCSVQEKNQKCTAV